MAKAVTLVQVIKEVVAGERDWRQLNDFGVTVQVDAAGVKVMGGGAGPVRVGAMELARGWLRHASDETALRAWARFVHGAVGLIELDVDDHPLGEKLLDSLWRISFGEAVEQQMHTIARRVLVTEVSR